MSVTDRGPPDILGQRKACVCQPRQQGRQEKLQPSDRKRRGGGNKRDMDIRAGKLKAGEKLQNSIIATYF